MPKVSGSERGKSKGVQGVQGVAGVQEEEPGARSQEGGRRGETATGRHSGKAQAATASEWDL